MIQIEWLSASLEEARFITGLLLKKHLIACANIQTGIESHYIWQGVEEKSQEVKVLFKTKKALFAEVEKCIKTHGSYKVPAILAFSILQGHEPYLSWVESSCTT